MYIEGDREWNESLFDDLEEHKTEIESSLGESLLWLRLDNIKACRIEAVRSGTVDDGEEALEEIREWMVERLLKLKAVFDPMLEELVD